MGCTGVLAFLLVAVLWCQCKCATLCACVRSFKLSDYKGKWVVLFYYPKVRGAAVAGGDARPLRNGFPVP